MTPTQRPTGEIAKEIIVDCWFKCQNLYPVPSPLTDAITAALEAERTEVTRLKEALRMFGQHSGECGVYKMDEDFKDENCDCGYLAALQPKDGRVNEDRK